MSQARVSSLLAGAGRYSLGSILAMAASIARVALTARLLTSDSAGVWLGIQVVLGYGANLHLGVLYGMFRSVPLLRARDEQAAAASVVQTSFTVVLVSAALGGLGAVPVTEALAHASRRHALECAIVLAISLLRSYFNTLFKAENRYAELGATSALGGAASILSLPLIGVLGLDGVLAGMLVQYLVETLYMIRGSSLPQLGIGWPVLRDQLRVGGMTMLTTVGAVLLTSVDRTVMLRMCGTAAAGTYYLGANVLVLVPMMIALPFAVLTPKFFERVGRGEDLVPLVAEPLRAAADGLAPLLAAGAALVVPVIDTFFPRLHGGELATGIAIAGSYPLVLASFSANVFYAMDRQLPSLLLLLASAGIGLGGAWVGAALGHGVSGVAAGAACGFLAYHVLSTTTALRVAGRTWGEGALLVARSLVPGVGATVLYAATTWAVSRLPLQAWPRALAVSVLMLLLGAPLLRRSATSLRAMR